MLIKMLLCLNSDLDDLWINRITPLFNDAVIADLCISLPLIEHVIFISHLKESDPHLCGADLFLYGGTRHKKIIQS